MSENLYVMPSGEALPRCAYCQSRPILYRLKDYEFSTGDVFDAYFGKDCDGIGQALQHHGNGSTILFGEVVGPLMEERMFYHSWAAEQSEEILRLSTTANDRNIIYGNAIIVQREGGGSND